MIPRNISEEEEQSGQMSAAAIAKSNNALFKRIPGDLLEANIILICINHITTKISINPMNKVSADLNFLKPEEGLPGGTGFIFISDTLIILKAKGKLDPAKDFGIKGFFIEASFIKSRNSAAGRPFTLVYDQVYGFDNTFTNYNFLKDMKKTGGGGRGFYLEGKPDTKFAQKDFADKLAEDKKFCRHYEQLLLGALEELVPVIE
jgi:hypothetical protein